MSEAYFCLKCKEESSGDYCSNCDNREKLQIEPDDFLSLVYERLKKISYKIVPGSPSSRQPEAKQKRSKNKLIWTIGRHDDNQFVENHRSVSNHHCELMYVGKILYIRDLNSTNGTYVNNRKISEMRRVEVLPGDKIQFGSYTISPGIMTKIKSDIKKAAQNRQDENSKNFLRWKLGRHDDNHFVVKNQAVSKNHCMIIYDRHKLYIKDLKSTNGTYVNKRKISQMRRVEIVPDDKIQFGSHTISPDIMVRINSSIEKLVENRQDQSGNDFLRWKIGRNNDNHFVVKHQAVSKNHCIMTYDGQKLYIKDLRSTNGTYVNNRKISQMRRVVVSTADEIKFGSHKISPNIMSKIQSEIEKAARNQQDNKNESNSYQDVDLTDNVWNIGRYSGNEIQVKKPMVSGHHCQIIKKGNRWFIQDNKSTNGTKVNEERIDPYEKREIFENDTIHLGSHKLELDIFKSNDSINTIQRLSNKYSKLKTSKNELLYFENVLILSKSYHFVYLIYSDFFDEHERELINFYEDLCREKQSMEKAGRISIVVIIFFKTGFDDNTIIKKFKSKSRRSNRFIRPYSLKFVPINLLSKKQKINRFSIEDYNRPIKLSLEQLKKKDEEKEDSNFILTTFKQYISENFTNFWIVFFQLVMRPKHLANLIKNNKVNAEAMRKFWGSSIAIASIIPGTIYILLCFLHKYFKLGNPPFKNTNALTMFYKKIPELNELMKIEIFGLISPDNIQAIVYLIFISIITFILHLQFKLCDGDDEVGLISALFAMSYLFFSFLPIYSISLTFIQILGFFLFESIEVHLLILMVVINIFFIYSAIPLLLYLYEVYDSKKLLVISLANTITISLVLFYVYNLIV